VLTALSSCLKTLLYQPSCPLCSQPLTDDQDEQRPCESCNRRLGLRSQLLHGRAPLTWVAAGLYSGALRQLLLQLRRSRDTKTIAALCANLRDHLPSDALLVPIPSWKHASRANKTSRPILSSRSCRPSSINTSRPCFSNNTSISNYTITVFSSSTRRANWTSSPNMSNNSCAFNISFFRD